MVKVDGVTPTLKNKGEIPTSPEAFLIHDTVGGARGECEEIPRLGD